MGHSNGTKRRWIDIVIAISLVVALVTAFFVVRGIFFSDRDEAPLTHTATGRDGAVSSVDADATRIGLQVLRDGGNAADAAVATASALGVTEPYSAGIGGGGYFVYRDAESGEVTTIDGQSLSPKDMQRDAFIDPETDKRYRLSPDLVTSGVAVGVPGTPATWEAALADHGTISLADALKPSIELARNGFMVDETFRDQTRDNEKRFEAFPATAELFLPDGTLPAVGSTMRNPDLADTLQSMADSGVEAFYRGPIADDVARTVQRPPIESDADYPAPAGSLTATDMADYEVRRQAPTHTTYRGLDVYGMAPSSSGGTAVGEALDVLSNFELAGGDETPRSLHLMLEASAVSFADRSAYVGDEPDVPVDKLLSAEFGEQRACTIDPDQASKRPVPAGDLDGTAEGCQTTDDDADRPDTEGTSTTHVSVVDKWGNAASYSLTNQRTGGSAITVPGRGFLLNNSLTNFTANYDPDDPDRIEPDKRPGSAMSPTIVAENGEIRFVLGTPGGTTIITTVLQVLVGRVDLGMSLPDAVAAPRASQRNTKTTSAEPAFIDEYGEELDEFDQDLEASGDEYTSAAEIGAVAAIERTDDGLLTAAAEPTRRGGGSAAVVKPE